MIFDSDTTFGDILHAVHNIASASEARQFLEDYSAFLESKGCGSKEKCSSIARANIGWCFGEGLSQERIDFWNEAVGAEHPYFGTKKPTMEEAFEMGVAAGRKAKEEHDKA